MGASAVDAVSDVWSGDGVVKIMVLGDIHLSDRPPSVRKDTYTQEILDKVDFCVQKAASTKCSAVLALGDVFHVKVPSRTTHKLVQRTHEVLSSVGVPVLIVPGNHDVMHDQIESLDSQPLGALGRMEGIELLTFSDPKTVHAPIYGLPYLSDWETLPQHVEKFVEWAGNRHPSEWKILATHAPIFPLGQAPPYDYIAALDLASMVSDVPNVIVAYGHIHDQHKTYRVADVVFANYGALSRGSLHKETLARQPQAYIFDTTTGEISPFDIPVLPASEVFNLTEVQIVADAKDRMTTFLDDVGNIAVGVTSVESVADHVSENVDLDLNIKVAVKELLEYAEHVSG